MTDNEIIRVLIDYGTQCKQEVISEAIDLINRQKAENDSLKVDLAKCSIRLDNLYKTADEIKSEAIKECLARVKNYIKTHCNPYGKPDFDYNTSIKILNFIDEIKSEAIKEFAERLKEKVSRGFWDELAYVDVDDIDNLVKEMTEEK